MKKYDAHCLALTKLCTVVYLLLSIVHLSVSWLCLASSSQGRNILKSQKKSLSRGCFLLLFLAKISSLILLPFTSKFLAKEFKV